MSSNPSLEQEAGAISKKLIENAIFTNEEKLQLVILKNAFDSIDAKLPEQVQLKIKELYKKSGTAHALCARILRESLKPGATLDVKEYELANNQVNLLEEEIDLLRDPKSVKLHNRYRNLLSVGLLRGRNKENNP